VKIGSNLSIDSGTGVLSADTQSDVNFTSALNTKLAGIETGATAGANFATNVSNISVTNAQLAGSIENSKLTNSSVTVNGSTVALGGSITLTTANVAEGANLYFTEERVDDRVYALLSAGEGLDISYDDPNGTLTLSSEDATTTNKGVASFASATFDVASGAVSVKSGGISNAQLAGSIANDKLLDIAQGKVTGLTSALNSKVENLSDLSITASAAEINILDGVTGVSSTEIGYLDGVTSAIQTQLDGKQASGNYLTTSSTITSLSGITEFDTDITAVSSTHDSVPSAKAVKEYVDMVSFDANDTQYTFSVEDTNVNNTKRLKLTGTDGSFTSVNFEGSGGVSVTRINERIIIDSTAQPVESVAFSGNTLTLTKIDNSTVTATIPDATTSVHGLMTDDQFDKLAGIESGATADQTASEIRTLVESATDSNVFTDADHSKLNAIEANATADQTASEIRTLVESATDSNVFTDADHTKLNGIESNATADQTGAEIKTALFNESDTNNLTDTLLSKLNAIEANATADQTASEVTALLNDVASYTLGTSGSGTITIANDLVVTGTTTTNNVETVSTSNGVVFEGNAADGNEVTLLAGTVTADRTITLPDATGTVLLTDGSGASLTSLNGSQITTGTVAAARIGNLSASKITTGTFPTARIADDAVTVAKIDGLTDLGSGVVISSAERTKLSGIEASADVTDTANVTAAGALMDSEVTNLAQVKAFDSSDYATAAQGALADSAQQPPSEGAFVNGDKTKLDGIETGADVTDTANVTAAGALMDSEITNLAQVKAFDSSDYATAAQGTTADAALPKSGGTMTGNITFNSTQQFDGRDLSVDGAKLDGIEASADVTDATNVAAAGAIMDGDFTSNGFMKRTGAGTYTIDTSTYLTAHPSISAATSSDNSGRTYIQDITLDSNGHVTGIATATETVVNTDTQLTQAQVRDFAGGMFTGNTETFITATYQTSDDTIDLVVPVLDEDDMNSNSATHLATQQSIKAYVDTEVAGLVDSAPGALDTLNELAAAINDDATFSATVTTALGNRLRVDTASQGLSGTEQSNARTNLNVDVAGTDNSTDVTLATVTDNYLSISGQVITAGTVPLSLGGTGATSASAARTALGVDAAGTDNSTDVTLTGSGNYLSISGQTITVDPIDISDDTNLTAGTGLTLSGDTLNVNAAQSGITSVGTLSSLTVSGDVTVDTSTLKVDSTNNRVGIGTATPGYKLQVEGSFAAQTKSFVIPHPTQEGKTLQHGSLEGPEHGVYHRGRLSEGSVIQLPEYWTGLVDEDTISIQLTANGDFQMLYVEKIEDNQVFVANAADEGIDCFYLIHGERKDVGRMEVEY
jgi:hypothetical protein